MSKLIATRGAQYPLVAEFTFNFDDTMVDVDGVLKDFKTVGSTVVDAINLPTGAIVIGGEVVTETAVSTSSAYNIKVGDSNDDDRYLTVTDCAAAGRTALVPTGYVGNGEQIRVTVAPTDADATAGKVTVRVQYIVRNRVNESQTH
jgi:hypothetical protein